MKILYYDCFAGISGDMNIGAMIDLGVPFGYLIDELKKIHIDGYKLECKPGIKLGISGTYANVILEDHHPHGHGHGHGHSGHTHHHKNRNFHDICEIINNSSLNDFVKTKSIETFRHIAGAESKIHAKHIDEIHFHEVGAIDSIVDVVSAAICIDYLKPDHIVCSPVELGGGFVTCAHGTFPVPAPATAEILKDIPVRTGSCQKETTTPTGAAILKTYVNEFTDQVSFRIRKTAYGIGFYDLPIPNVLRVFLGEADKEIKGPVTEKSNALLVECNIDDMNPEQYEYIMEKLFSAGAQDVFIVPVIMKKSRPAIQLKVLSSMNDLPAIEEILLKETTSIGIRYYPVTKSMMKRNIITVETAYGPVRIKEALLDNKVIKYKAEYEDCTQAARKHNVSLREIYLAVDHAFNKK